MEPIQTPSNEALHLRIEALKAGILMFEDLVEAYRGFAREDQSRNLELFLQLAERVNRLTTAVIALSLCVILLCMGSLLRGDFYSTVDCIFKIAMPFIGLFVGGTMLYLHFGYKKMYYKMKERYKETQEKLQRT